MSLRKLLAFMIEVIGEAIDARRPELRRAVAKEVIKLDHIALAMENMDPLAVALMFAELENIADASSYFHPEQLGAPGPYSTEGITFPALVHLVRIEETALAWEWLPEQLRALGLAINQGEELTWLTPEWAEIRDREGNLRQFYRLSS